MDAGPPLVSISCTRFKNGAPLFPDFGKSRKRTLSLLKVWIYVAARLLLEMCNLIRCA